MPLENEQPVESVPTSGSLSEAIARPTYQTAALTGTELRTPEGVRDDFELSFDFAKKAASEQWISPTRIAENLTTHYEKDEGFDPLSDDMVKAIPTHYTDDQQQAMMEAKSEDHWLDLKDEFDAAAQFQEELAMGGPAAQFWAGAVGLFDPTALAAIGLTEGAAIAWLSRGQKLRNMSVGASAAITGGAGASSEAVLAALRGAQHSDYTEEDALIDMALGAGVGGALGAGYTAYHQFGKALLADRAAKKAGKDASAMETRESGYETNVLDRTQNAKMKRSASSKLNEIADALSSSGANPNGVAADATADQFRTHNLAGHNKVLDEAFREYRKDSGVGAHRIFKTRLLRKEFSEQAGQYQLQVMEGVADPQAFHPAVVKYAKAVDSLHAGIGGEGSQAGLSGFKDFTPQQGFFKRRWKQDSHLNVTNKNGEKITESQFQRLVYESMKRKVDDADMTPERDALIAKVAFGFSRNFMKSTVREHKSLDEFLFDEEGLTALLRDDGGMDVGSIQRLVQEAFSNASEDITKRVDLKGKKANGKQNAYDRGKRRMQIDMLHEVDGFNLGMFIETDLERMTNEYILEMGGHIAMSRHLGVKNPTQLDELRNKITDDVPQAEKEKTLELFEQVRREIYGKPMVDQGDSGFHRGLQQMRRVTFTTSMGMASLAALTEISTIVSENGVRACLRNMPELAKMTKAAFLRREGPTLVREANSFGGAIGDDYLATMFQELDDIAMQEGRVDGLLNKADIVTHGMQRAMGYLSFLEPIDRTMRMYAFSTANTSIYHNLMKGASTRFPYADYGIGKTLKKRIKEQFAAHPPVLDKFGAVTKNNFENWDATVRRDYLAAMHRAGTMQVQKQLAGEKVAMFEHPLGKMWLQFRSFMVGSWAKHTLRTYGRFKSGEGRSAAVIAQLVAIPLATSQYIARTYAQAVGREDQDEFLEKRLRPEVVAATAANYVPALGMPMASLATGAYIAGTAIPIFRSSGYAPDLATAGPVPEFFQGAAQAARNASLSARDELDWSDANWRAASRLVPFNNTLIGTAFVNTMLHYND